MPLLKQSEFQKHIKTRRFSPVYVLSGGDQMIIKKFTRELVEAVAGKSPSEFNFHSFGGEVNLDTLSSAIGVVPFMSEYNCVLVTDIFFDMLNPEDIDKFKAICKMKAEGTVLIISMPSYIPKRNAKAWDAILKRAEKDGTVVKFAELNDSDLEKVIGKWVSSQGKLIKRVSASRLIKLCGKDMTRLKNEVDKLCAYAEGEEITMDAIELLVPQTLEERIFALSDHVLAGREDMAFQTLDRLFAQKEEPVVMLYVLSNAFIDAYRVRVADESGVPESVLGKDFAYGKRTFVLRKVRTSTKNVSTGALRRCLDVLAEADEKLKSVKVNERFFIEQIIAQLLLLAREGRR